MVQDKFLIIFGTVFGGKPLAYGRVDQSKLEKYPRKLLRAYSHVLMTLCAAILLPLFCRLELWTVVACVPLAVGCFVLMGMYEKKLDPLLKNHFVKDDD
jgi:hypothetical protein